MRRNLHSYILLYIVSSTLFNFAQGWRVDLVRSDMFNAWVTPLHSAVKVTQNDSVDVYEYGCSVEFDKFSFCPVAKYSEPQINPVTSCYSGNPEVIFCSAYVDTISRSSFDKFIDSIKYEFKPEDYRVYAWCPGGRHNCNSYVERIRDWLKRNGVKLDKEPCTVYNLKLKRFKRFQWPR